MSNSTRKKERRRLRYERNVRKEKEYKAQAWKEGKLIEPNHNNGPYPPDYSIELGKRLYERIQTNKGLVYQSPDSHLPEGFIWENMTEEEKRSHVNNMLLYKFRLYRIKIRDFILHYNPDIPKTPEYEYLKLLIETYWDTPEKLIEVC